MTIGGCAEEEIPVDLQAAWAIGMGQSEIPVIKLIFGTIGAKTHPGLFGVPMAGKVVSNFVAETTGGNECHHRSPLF